MDIEAVAEKPWTCPNCKGAGKRLGWQNNIDGEDVLIACDRCDGTGTAAAEHEPDPLDPVIEEKLRGTIAFLRNLDWLPPAEIGNLQLLLNEALDTIRYLKSDNYRRRIAIDVEVATLRRNLAKPGNGLSGLATTQA